MYKNKDRYLGGINKTVLDADLSALIQYVQPLRKAAAQGAVYVRKTV